jgi:hypothetical protein
VTRPAPSLNGPDDEAARFERARDTRRITAVADVYVLTNTIRDLLEDRLEAIGRAVGNGATEAELAQALAGADQSGSELDRRILAECQAELENGTN